MAKTMLLTSEFFVLFYHPFLNISWLTFFWFCCMAIHLLTGAIRRVRRIRHDNKEKEEGRMRGCKRRRTISFVTEN